MMFLDKSGSGIKTRVVQALAAGKPVLGSKVALEGIKITEGINAFVCNTSDDVTRIVDLLLRDASLRARVGHAARELAKTHYEQSIIGEQWEMLYHKVMNSFVENKINRGQDVRSS
jgi:glycosyltransferase involved in cell wall biosynthesis